MMGLCQAVLCECGGEERREEEGGGGGREGLRREGGGEREERGMRRGKVEGRPIMVLLDIEY